MLWIIPVFYFGIVLCIAAVLRHLCQFILQPMPVLNLLSCHLWMPFPDAFCLRGFCIFLLCVVRGGADKSLASPTCWYRRMESIVLLERGVCSCAELKVFSSYRGWKEACQATRAISKTSRRELSSSYFPASQGAEENSRHSDRNIRGTCTITCHRQKLGGTV
jgi:hypothetical protein